MADIWDAIAASDQAGVASLVTASPQLVGAVSPRGITPLILAVQADYQEVCKLLLDFGADPNQLVDIRSPVSGRVDKRVSAVMFASSVPVLEMLVKAGADINLIDGNGRSVFLRIATSYDERLASRVMELGGIVQERHFLWLLDLIKEELEFRVSQNEMSDRTVMLKNMSVWCESRLLQAR